MLQSFQPRRTGTTSPRPRCQTGMTAPLHAGARPQATHPLVQTTGAQRTVAALPHAGSCQTRTQAKYILTLHQPIS